MLDARDNEWLTPETVAQRLNVRRRSVYDAIKRGDLGAIKIGNQIRVHPDHLDAFIAASTMRPQRRQPTPRHDAPVSRAPEGTFRAMLHERRTA